MLGKETQVKHLKDTKWANAECGARRPGRPMKLFQYATAWRKDGQPERRFWLNANIGRRSGPRECLTGARAGIWKGAEDETVRNGCHTGEVFSGLRLRKKTFFCFCFFLFLLKRFSGTELLDGHSPCGAAPEEGGNGVRGVRPVSRPHF